MPFKKLSRRTFLTASWRLPSFIPLSLAHFPPDKALTLTTTTLTTGSPHLNKPSAKGKQSSCLADWFVTISTPASLSLPVKRYTSLEACAATAEGDLSYRTAAR